jgi:Dyp-type peroxidase family
MSAPELHDVQGLVARGYGDLTAARFLLLGIDDAAAAREWLGALAVTPADARPEERAVNVALTSAGLAALGVDDELVGLFSNEFADGMTAPHRSRNLGDLEENAPQHWDWGGPGTPAVHAVLLLYARDEPALAALVAEQQAALGPGLRVVTELYTSDLDRREPFGFADGISQPIIEGLSKKGPPETTLRFGEFVLGYLNEYGRYTDQPLLDARPELGHNGSYLVLRQLRQDVTGFWRFVDEATRRVDGSSDETRRVRLAAKMVGRWPSGAPLTLAPDGDDPERAERNDFAYRHEDPHGARCPIGAHIRRANPRDSLDPKPGTEKSWAINRRHRILRRGREYGDEVLTPARAVSLDAPERERGLHFICLNGNIARQFEFVNDTWLNSPKFAGLYDDADPLVAPSSPHGGTFTVQSETIRERVTGVPRFVSVKGGAYFFMPGLAALRHLARLGG